MSIDKELRKKRFEELAARAVSRGQVCATNFIDPSERRMAESAAKRAGAAVLFVGGYAEAERAVAVFAPNDAEAAALSSDIDYADTLISCVKLTWDARYSSIAHPDILGATLSVFNDRAVYGDIIARQGEAYVFALKSVADTVLANLTTVGRATVKATPFSFSQSILAPTTDTARLRATLPSLRLDACVAAAYNLSRSESQSIIASGAVRLNFAEETRPDVKLSQGDLISIRKLGRAALTELQGENRKGRVIAVFAHTAHKKRD